MCNKNIFKKIYIMKIMNDLFNLIKKKLNSEKFSIKGNFGNKFVKKGNKFLYLKSI